jgi:hypothetical protein
LSDLDWEKEDLLNPDRGHRQGQDLEIQIFTYVINNRLLSRLI